MHTRNATAVIERAANPLGLTGTGAAYLRVSTTGQETERQLAAIRRWEAATGLHIDPKHIYVDEGFVRDLADKRPDFQRMLANAEAGRINWIVIDVDDRFGAANERKLVRYVDQLMDAGCRLVTIDNEELTGDDLMTFFKLGMSGRKSREEQETKSKRVLEAKLLRAKRGEWQGGQVPYGMDVVCFDATGEVEKWRVEFSGRTLVGKLPNGKRKYDTHRIKISPDGTRETYDGWRNFPASDPTDILQLRPSHDSAKLAVVAEVFRSYATEAVNPTQLARRLNQQGIKPTYSDRWTCNMVMGMLANTTYIGRPATNKMGQGRFYEFVGGERRKVDPKQRDRRRPKTDWVLSDPIFDPVIPADLWEAVQAKVDGNPAKRRAPKHPKLWLSHLLFCAGCGQPMRGYAAPGDARFEYFCSSYAHKVEGCTCKRNAVPHGYVEEVVKAYLADSGTTLAGLETGTTDAARERFWKQYKHAMASMVDTEVRMMARMVVSTGNPDLAVQYKEQLRANPTGILNNLVDEYRARHSKDAPALDARRRELEARHTQLTEAWTTLPTPRAREKAKAQLEGVEAELDRVEGDLRDVATEYEQLHADVMRVGAEWEAALASMGDDITSRRKADAVGKVVSRINCHFEPTGKAYPTSRLVKIEVIPHEYPNGASGCRGGGLP